MAKSKTQFLCNECGDTFTKWFGKCPSCRTFGTVKEFNTPNISSEKNLKTGINLVINSKSEENVFKKRERILTKINEADRVLGGGFFPSSVVLLGGHPGVGKSTLACQIFLSTENAFYFSGEESKEQIISRATRIQKNPKTDHIFSTNSLEDIIATLEKNRPLLAIIDSIQMIGTENSTFGSVNQIRENAEILIRAAKTLGTSICLIGHVTKNDELAGPKVLEHLVDAVLYFSGEQNSEIRILRAVKNRFGSTAEIGVFEMSNLGLLELKNPSEFFLSERAENASGSSISVIREGARNFLLEIQVLTIKTNFSAPKRTSRGINLNKLHLLCAVISKFTIFKMESYDAYANVVGGMRIDDPAVDAAICASILSSRAEQEIAANTVIFGEVGLSGEIRHIGNFESRIHEAEKLGFQKVICPRLPKNFNQKILKNIKIIEVKNIAELFREIVRK
jgi:DNA repair protein RadA/Sms